MISSFFIYSCFPENNKSGRIVELIRPLQCVAMRFNCPKADARLVLFVFPDMLAGLGSFCP